MRKVFDRTPSVGTAFETRPGLRTLLYGTSLGAERLFSMEVPVPRRDDNG